MNMVPLPACFIAGRRNFVRGQEKYSNEFPSSSNKGFEKKIATLEAKLTHKNEILAELMEEYISLKNVRGPVTGC
jgi:hypothetical protein